MDLCAGASGVGRGLVTQTLLSLSLFLSFSPHIVRLTFSRFEPAIVVNNSIHPELVEAE